MSAKFVMIAVFNGIVGVFLCLLQASPTSVDPRTKSAFFTACCDPNGDLGICSPPAQTLARTRFRRHDSQSSYEPRASTQQICPPGTRPEAALGWRPFFFRLYTSRSGAA